MLLRVQTKKNRITLKREVHKIRVTTGRGPQGKTGDDGLAATVDIGTTTTLAPGSQATVNNSGTENNAVLNFGIPSGANGSAATNPNL